MKFSEIVTGNCVQYSDTTNFVATSDAAENEGVFSADGFIVDGDSIITTRWFSNGDNAVQLITEKYQLI